MNTNIDTMDKCYKTLEKLLEQRDKIEKVDNNLNNIQQHLSYSEYLVKKMSSFMYNIGTKFRVLKSESLKPGEISETDETINIHKKPINIHIHKKPINIHKKYLQKNDNNSSDEISDQLRILKELNLIIGDELDLHNNILENIQIKVESNTDKVTIISNNIHNL